MKTGELEFVHTLIPTKKQKVEETIRSIEMPQASREWMRELGPRAACAQLDFNKMGKQDKVAWMEQARVASILGASSRTLPSVRSGLKCYLYFASMLVLHL